MTRSAHAFRRVAEILEQPLPNDPRVCSRKLQDVVDVYTEMLDSIAYSRKAIFWVEKTPKHFRYIEHISKTVNNTRFIHMVRDGRDVVASIVDRARKYPEHFGHQRDPRYAVRLWNASIHKALHYHHDPAHMVVFYGSLVEEPETELARISSFLQIRYVRGMLKNQDTDHIVSSYETWKDSSASDIGLGVSKFRDTLSESEQRNVARSLDWDALDQLMSSMTMDKT